MRPSSKVGVLSALNSRRAIMRRHSAISRPRAALPRSRKSCCHDPLPTRSSSGDNCSPHLRRSHVRSPRDVALPRLAGGGRRAERGGEGATMKIRVDIDWRAPGDLQLALISIKRQLEALRVSESDGYRVVSVREWKPKWWELLTGQTRTDGPCDTTLSRAPESERGRGNQNLPSGQNDPEAP